MSGLAFTRGDRLLVVAPHPDDETLATGGLLQHAVAAGSAVRVLFVTDGENNPWPQRYIERRWRIGPAERSRWAGRRRAESLAALAAMGVSRDSAAFLGYPDQGITGMLLAADDALVAALARELAGWRPTVLAVSSLDDLHPDHSAVAVMARLALRRVGQSAGRREVAYIVHTRPSARVCGDVILPLDPQQRERKRQAIVCHASQIRLRPSLVNLADADERFLMIGPAAATVPGGAVRRVSIEPGSIRLDVRIRSCLGAFGPSTLQLFAHSDPSDGRGCFARLQWRSGPFAIRQVKTGEAIGDGRIVRRRHGGEITLPIAALSPLDRLFVKIDRRFGFFDEAGWCEIAVPPIHS